MVSCVFITNYFQFQGDEKIMKRKSTGGTCTICNKDYLHIKKPHEIYSQKNKKWLGAINVEKSLNGKT